MFDEHRKKSSLGRSKSIKSLLKMATPADFLAEEKRALIVERINNLISLEALRYESLCSVLIEQLINYNQQLPESTNSYYSQLGGLVDFALQRTEAALTLFQEFIIPKAADHLTEEQKLWQYVLFSAGILQGIGKIYTDYKVQLFDANGFVLSEWNPLLEPLNYTGFYYDYALQKEAPAEFRRRLNIVFAKILMPNSGFAWIASHPKALAIWLALLNEDMRAAGTLGAILVRANAQAIQRYFAELALHPDATEIPVGHHRKANTFSGGVPQVVIDKEQLIGIDFIQWLNQSLASGQIMVNKAPLLAVPGGLLMCNELFQLFVREHPEYKNWQAVQQGFLALNMHTLGLDGSMTSRSEHPNHDKIYEGILCADYAIVLPDTVTVLTGQNKSAHLPAIELIHQLQSQQLSNHQHLAAYHTIEHVNTAGQWQAVQEQPVASAAPSAGVPFSG